MDEQPGGGGGGGGGGMAAQRQQQQPAPQQGNNSINPQIASAGGAPMVQQQQEEMPRPQQYTIPGILHYIQHEWARFEMERAHWEVERAELQARIAFLQGERKGQENLKNDLVRRIKMLEYALKQERRYQRYRGLSYTSEQPVNVETGQATSQTVGNEGLASDLPDDADTEEALKEFDFLVNAEDGEGAGEARSSGDGTEWAEPLPFTPGGGKSFIMGSDDMLESVLGLGDLADLTVSNDEAEYSYDLPANKDAFRKTWNPKYTLRSHFDGVRALAFHPVEPVLVTVSEDHTLKLWNLQKTVPAKNGPVLSLAVTSSGEQCFSGGIDSTIQWWNIPSSNVDPYDTYDPSVLAGTLLGHSDGVWGLAYSGIKNRLLSCSADGTIKLWNPQEKSPCLSTFNSDRDHGVPTSIDFNGCDPAHMVASYNTGDAVVYDLETSQPIVVFAAQGESGKAIHAMVAHLDAVTSLAIDPNGIYLMSGSHDSSIRLWNLDSKTCVQEVTAHRKKSDEAIYDVAFHPSKAYIGSAGADALAKVFV
ncbi:Striatin-3 [Anabarilius grahami]|uniref:Striatin-3 n=1 Tax=Anabarilius grahami TaxID=495550 RepID=A0A3N0Y5T8_ANAGA|nr:Striatin-3 [Anabarilius grahami]